VSKSPASRAVILEEVDPETNTNLIKLEPISVAQSQESELLLAVHFKRVNGAAPDYVHVTLFSRSPRCRFPVTGDLQLVADHVPTALALLTDSSRTVVTARMEDVRVYFAKREGVLWVQRDQTESGCNESLAAALLPATFNGIAKSQKMDLVIGESNFSLSASNLAALRDIAARIAGKPAP
jgi:hypothetical protein